MCWSGATTITTATTTTGLNGSVSTRAAGARSWSPKLWSVDSNYFAAAVINTFHSRRAYLHGPAAATAGTAIARFNVAMPGSYHVLVRYEATYEHETGFRVRLEQGGQTLFTRVYGMLDNLKMWRTWGPAAQRDDPNIGPFRGRNSSQHCYGHLASVCKFPDGPMGLVWEGINYDSTFLNAGVATLYLELDAYDGHSPQFVADRNLDLVMLTTNKSDILARRKWDTAGLLPPDGLVHQGGEVFARAKNTGVKDLVVLFPFVSNFSPAPYLAKIRHPIWSDDKMVSGCTRTGGPACTTLTLPAQKRSWSEWVEVVSASIRCLRSCGCSLSRCL